VRVKAVRPIITLDLQPATDVSAPWSLLRRVLKSLKRSWGLRARAFVRREDVAAAVADGELVEVKANE
jgi:hypothetical protein